MGRRKGLLSAIITVAQVLVLAVIISISHTGARAKAAGSIDITGTVNNSSGVGVSNVSVYATDPGTNNVDFGPITTGNDGSYDLQVSAGTYDFHYVPASGSGLSPIVDSDVTVLNDQPIDVQLINSTNTLSGTVLNADGSVAVGVEVVATSYSDGNNYFGTTNSLGNYTIQVDPGTYSVGAEVFHYVPGSSPQQYLSTSEVNTASGIDLTSGGVNVNFQLPDTSATLTVSVQDGNGNPVPGTQVSLEQYTPCSGGYCSSVLTGDLVGGGGAATVGSSGQINFSVMPNVNIRAGSLCAYFSVIGKNICNTSPITVSSSGAALTLAESSTNTLSGTVLNADGSVAVGVEVVATSYSDGNNYFGTTNSLGNYTIQVDPGTYSVGAEVFHYVPGSSPQQYLSTSEVNTASGIDLTSGGVNVNFQLPDTSATLTVSVQDGNGNPVPGTQVSLEQYTPCSGGYCSSVLTGDLVGGGGAATVGSSGQINFSVMPNVNIRAGSLCAYFSVIGKNICNTSPITVSSSGAALTLAESSTNTLSGTVLNADGSVAVGVEVVATSYSDGNNYFGTTNSLGNYTIQVDPGTYSVGAEVFHYVPGSSPQQYLSTSEVNTASGIDLTSGGVNVNFQLPDTSATLTVSVQDGNGNPVPGTQVSLEQYTPCSGGYCSSVLTGDLVGGGGAATVGSSGQINFSVMPNVNIRAGSLCAYFSVIGKNICNTSPITVSSSGAALVFSEQPPAPSAPTNLTALTPTNQPPALSWTAGSTTNNPSASYYNIYRNGTDIGSSSTTSFTDTNAPSGTNSYYVTAVSLNGVESSPSNTLSVIYNSAVAPTITSPNTSSTGTTNFPYSFTVTTTGTPAPSITQTGTLPPGLAFTDNGNGTATITGTPSVLDHGSYPVTVTATNSAGSVNQTLTITVPPAFTSSNSDTEVFGTAVNFPITTTGFSSYATIKRLEGDGQLPPGLSLTYNGNGTATISGTPNNSANGQYSFTLSATNNVGSPVTQVFTMTITKAPVFKLVRTSQEASVVGTPYSLTITASGYGSPSLSESGTLPSGLTFHDNGNGTATISGTPAVGSGGAYPFTVTATNSYGTTTDNLTIKNAEAPTITSTNNATATPGSAFYFAVTASGYPSPTYSLTGTLPNGIHFYPGPGTFGGTPNSNDTPGTYNLTLTASNSQGSVNQSFTLTVL